MSKVQMLRCLVEQRLSAAAEEIFKMFERTIAEYEQELSRTKEENDKRQRLLEQVLQRPECPPDVHQQPVVKDEVPPEQRDWSPRVDVGDPEPSRVKEEQEELWTNQEAPSSHIPLNRGDDENEAQSSVLQQTQTEEDTEDSGQSDTDMSLVHTQDISHRLSNKRTTSDRRPPRRHGDTGCRPVASECAAVFCQELDVSQVSHGNGDTRDNTTLTGHKRKRHGCFVCGKVFDKRLDLERHMRVHTGEKPFNCPQCERSFALKGTLLSHMRIHTGEKPFVCPVCQKGFRQKGHLQRHVKSHRRQAVWF